MSNGTYLVSPVSEYYGSRVCSSLIIKFNMLFVVHFPQYKQSSLFQVGWIYQEVSDIDLKTLKTVVQSITHGGGQVHIIYLFFTS